LNASSDLTAAPGDQSVAPEIPSNGDVWPLVTKYDWGLLGARITLSAGVYPVIVGGAFAVIALAGFVARVLSGSLNAIGGPLEMAAVVPGMLVVMLMMMVGGGLWGGIVTAVVLPVVYLVAWSLQMRMSFIRLGAFSGGLIGFVAVLPFVVPIAFEMVAGPSFVSVLIAALAIGPALTTIIGQLGGAWGGFGALQNYRLNLLVNDAPDQVITDLAAEHPPRLQFQIRHLLWATLWISVLLGALRLLGLPIEAVVPLLCGWLLYQWATLSLGGWLLRRLVPWWIARRCQRST
jgi:hypothetical protein